MDDGQMDSDFGIKIDAVFSLASTETEAEECIPKTATDSTSEEGIKVNAETDVKSCEVRLVDIFDEKIIREYTRRKNGHWYSKQQSPNVEECKNFDVVFAKDAVYERGKRKRKLNAMVKGPEYVEAPPSCGKKEKIQIGPEKTKYRNVKVSPAVFKQRKPILYERNKSKLSQIVHVDKIVQVANYFLSLAGKSKPAKVYRPQVARTKKKLRKREREIATIRTSSPSPPLLEPVSTRVETSMDEKPPKLEPEFSGLNLDSEDASLSLSFSGRFRKKSKRLGNDFVIRKKRKVAKVTPLQTKKPESATKLSDLESLTESLTSVPRMHSLLRRSPKSKRAQSTAMAQSDFSATPCVKTPEFTAAVNKLAKKENTKKFFQLKIGEKIVLIPTDGTSVMPKAFVLDAPIKGTTATQSFQTQVPIALTDQTPQETCNAKNQGIGGEFPETTTTSTIFSLSRTSASDNNGSTGSVPAHLQSVKQEPPDLAYKGPDPEQVKPDDEYLPPDHDYVTFDTDVKPFQEELKSDRNYRIVPEPQCPRYVEASLSPVNPDMVMLRLKNNAQSKTIPQMSNATAKKSQNPSLPKSEVVVLPTAKQATVIESRLPNSYNKSILPKIMSPSATAGKNISLILPNISSADVDKLLRSREIIQQVVAHSQKPPSVKILPSSTIKPGTVPSIKLQRVPNAKITSVTSPIPIQTSSQQSPLLTALKQKNDKSELTYTATSNASTTVSSSLSSAVPVLAKLPNGKLVCIVSHSIPTCQSPNYNFIFTQSSVSSILSAAPSPLSSTVGVTYCTPPLPTETMTTSMMSSSSMTTKVSSLNRSFYSNADQVKVICPSSKVASSTETQISTPPQHHLQISGTIPYSRSVNQNPLQLPHGYVNSGSHVAPSTLKHLSNVQSAFEQEQLVVKMPFEKSADTPKGKGPNTGDEHLGKISSVDLSIVKQEPLDDIDTELCMPKEVEKEEETVNVKQEIQEQWDVNEENTGNNSETDSEVETTTSHLQFEHLTLDNGNTATVVSESIPDQDDVDAEEKIRKLKEMIRVQKEKVEKLRKSNLLSI